MSIFKGVGSDLDPLADLNVKNLERGSLVEPLYQLHLNYDKFIDLLKINFTSEQINYILANIETNNNTGTIEEFEAALI